MTNRTNAKPISSKAQPLLVAMPKLAQKGNEVQEPPLTVESLTTLGHAQALEWLNNVCDLRTNASLLSWRDGCRDELHDILPTLTDLSYQQKQELLNAWTTSFDAETGDELGALRGTVGDGRDDIDVAVKMARDLLQVALDELYATAGLRSRARTTIHAAQRYLDDIEKSVAFIDGWTLAEGAAK